MQTIWQFVAEVHSSQIHATHSLRVFYQSDLRRLPVLAVYFSAEGAGISLSTKKKLAKLWLVVNELIVDDRYVQWKHLHTAL